MMKDSNTLGERLLTCYERVIAIYQKTGNEDLAKPFEQKYLECRAESRGWYGLRGCSWNEG